MNNKKITTALTLLLLLGSGMAGAEWGDVYHCTSNSATHISFTGSQTKLELGKFQFELDRDRKGMVFSHGKILEIPDNPIRLGDRWLAPGTADSFLFSNGRYIYSLDAMEGIEVSTGTCDKF